jgi:hypothetical protein
MRKLTILISLALVCILAKAQNIYSALQLNQDREYKTVRPKKIIEINTFFNSSRRQVDKNIKTFDEAGMLIKEERYDENGILLARLSYTNDTIHRIKLKRIFERWTRYGYSKETANYNYDANFFLVEMTDEDQNGNVILQTNFVCNDNGHPIELSLLDGKGNSIGKEIATYLYDKNEVVTSVINNKGNVLSIDTARINFITASKFPAESEVYNTNGDLTNWTRRNVNGSITIFEEE